MSPYLLLNAMLISTPTTPASLPSTLPITLQQPFMLAQHFCDLLTRMSSLKSGRVDLGQSSLKHVLKYHKHDRS